MLRLLLPSDMTWLELMDINGDMEEISLHG
jgi:hypothetical protein